MKKIPISFLFIIAILFNSSCKKNANVEPRWVPNFIPKAVALEHIPLTKLGYPDWVQAMNEGIIHPLASLDPGNQEKEELLDLDIQFQNTKGGLLSVIFPHLPHTKWLKCANCHPNIFKEKKGANPINMTKIAQGEYCGRCHGIVAFPLNHCLRCHSGPILNPDSE